MQEVEEIGEYIPTQGMLVQQEMPTFILCKPKLMPLKSLTLEKLEKMQKEAEMKAKQQMKDNRNGSQEYDSNNM